MMRSGEDKYVGGGGQKNVGVVVWWCMW